MSHSVVVIDPQIQDYVRMHFNKGDDIHVEGYLSYRPIEAADGRERMCGNIIAVHVERVEKYKKSELLEDSDDINDDYDYINDDSDDEKYDKEYDKE